jgi:hypothetical protein
MDPFIAGYAPKTMGHGPKRHFKCRAERAFLKSIVLLQWLNILAWGLSGTESL